MEADRRAAFQRRVGDGLDLVGLREPARFARSVGRLARGGRLSRELAAARIEYPTAVPPPWLLYLTQGTVSAIDYHEGGRASARYVRTALRMAGWDLRPSSRVLDFGCGVGRILRWWGSDLRAEGCDTNARLVSWCSQHLAGVPVNRNPPAPPTALPDDSFDVVYAHSVMTHLPPDQQEVWMAEWTRLVRPGGAILVTFLGPSHLPPGVEVRSLEVQGRLVRSPGRAGRNLCAVWNTGDDVRERLGRRLTLALEAPRAMPMSDQDVYVFRVGA